MDFPVRLACISARVFTFLGFKPQPFLYQALYKILNNPVYIGRIRHKEKTYEGQHPPIISIELWDAVQSVLKSARRESVKRHAKHGSLLTGKCFSPEGGIYTPTYTSRGTLRYRYYIDKKTQHRIQSQALEALVTDTLRMLAAHAVHWRPCWAASIDYLIEAEGQPRWEALWAGWTALPEQTKQNIMELIIERILITKHQLVLRLSHRGMQEALHMVEVGCETLLPREAGFKPQVVQGESWVDIIIPAIFNTQGRSTVTVDAQGRPVKPVMKPNINPVLVNALVKSYRWNQQLESGAALTIGTIARHEGHNRTYISRIMNLMMLAPDVIASILEGTQPPTMQLQDLTASLPIDWHKQKHVLKFEH